MSPVKDPVCYCLNHCVDTAYSETSTVLESRFGKVPVSMLNGDAALKQLGDSRLFRPRMRETKQSQLPPLTTALSASIETVHGSPAWWNTLSCGSPIHKNPGCGLHFPPLLRPRSHAQRSPPAVLLPNDIFLNARALLAGKERRRFWHPRLKRSDIQSPRGRS